MGPPQLLGEAQNKMEARLTETEYIQYVFPEFTVNTTRTKEIILMCGNKQLYTIICGNGQGTQNKLFTNPPTPQTDVVSTAPPPTKKKNPCTQDIKTIIN